MENHAHETENQGMTPGQIDNLRAVVNYLYDDESKDYDESQGDRRRNHVPSPRHLH